MRLSKLKKISIVTCAVLFITPMVYLTAKDFGFKYIELENVSRFNEDRIAFQHVEKFLDPLLDNSVECLLIIKDKRMYLIKDGYDDLKQVKEQRLILDMQNKLIYDEQMWRNRINAKPDFVKITDRRVEILKNFNEEFVNKNFGNYYKTVRDAFIKRHVSIFIQLMQNRKDSGLIVQRKPIPAKLTMGEESTGEKFAISAVAKTIDGRVYYCEDADGDGITETFTVTIPDGFNWGYKSGPNIIYIFNNQNEALSEIIKNLAKYSYYGTEEEEKSIIENLPEEKVLIEMVQDLVPDEKFYK